MMWKNEFGNWHNADHALKAGRFLGAMMSPTARVVVAQGPVVDDQGNYTNEIVITVDVEEFRVAVIPVEAWTIDPVDASQ